MRQEPCHLLLSPRLSRRASSTRPAVAAACTPCRAVGHLDLISEPIRLVVCEMTRDDNVWLNWVAQRLFCSLPWLPNRFVTAGTGDLRGTPSDTETTTFLFDLTIKEGGAWEAARPARGSLCIVMERPGDRKPLGVMTGPTGEPCVLILGVTEEAADVIDEAGTIEPFLSYYTTNWKDGGMEELRKHWLRPRFIIRNPGEAVTLRVDAYRNYDNTSPYRSWTVRVASSGQTFWRDLGAADPRGDGFDWDDGSLWEGGVSGSANRSRQGARHRPVAAARYHIHPRGQEQVVGHRRNHLEVQRTDASPPEGLNMADFSYPNVINKDTPAIAAEVQSNFDAIRSWIWTTAYRWTAARPCWLRSSCPGHRPSPTTRSTRHTCRGRCWSSAPSSSTAARRCRPGSSAATGPPTRPPRSPPCTQRSVGTTPPPPSRKAASRSPTGEARRCRLPGR